MQYPSHYISNDFILKLEPRLFSFFLKISRIISCIITINIDKFALMKNGWRRRGWKSKYCFEKKSQGPGTFFLFLVFPVTFLKTPIPFSWNLWHFHQTADDAAFLISQHWHILSATLLLPVTFLGHRLLLISICSFMRMSYCFSCCSTLLWNQISPWIDFLYYNTWHTL